MSDSIAEAVNQLQAGRFQEAESICREVLRQNPDDYEANHLLAIISFQIGNRDDGVCFMQKAVALRPDQIDTRQNLAKMLQECERHPEAVSVYREIVDAEPVADSHINLGCALVTMKAHEEAIPSFAAAIACEPENADAHRHLADALYYIGRNEEAVESYNTAIGLRPDDVYALNNLGTAYFEMRAFAEAAAVCRKAISVEPGRYASHYNLGNALFKQGLFDEALTAMESAIALEPNLAVNHNNRANALQALYRYDEAVSGYNEAIRLEPDYALAHNNRGNALHNLGRIEEAIASLRLALKFDPALAEVHSNLIFLQNFNPKTDLLGELAERKSWNDRFVVPLAGTIKPHPNRPDPERRLRIGYVSADFKQHSAVFGFAPLILEHDRDRFDVFCYDGTAEPDEMTEILRAAATSWRLTHQLSDDDLAEAIRDDRIDILFDLSGHSNGNRLLTFGQKPAPIQVTGGDVPGVSTIDYRLTTLHYTAPEEEPLFVEKPIYLTTNFGFLPSQVAPGTGGPPCLEKDRFTFGSLNRLNKISEEVMTLWAEILLDVPDSQLLIKYRGLEKEEVQRRFKDFFAAKGIGEDRLILLGGTAQRQHLEAYNRVDIAFDTFPQSGGITTLESLWMGVPVLGIHDSFKLANRLIGALCLPLGLSGWIAENAGEYRRLGVEWAEKRAALADLRAELRRRVAEAYFRFPGDVETAYRIIWKRWCAGEVPVALDLSGENEAP